MGPLLIAALVMAVEPPRLTQQSPPATARVHVIDSATPPAHRLHLWCSTGNISEALDLGGGKWDAIYTAPTSGRPQYAVLAAWDEDSGTATAVTVPLEGRMEFPADTDPFAQVKVEVGSHRASGHADSQGHARVTALVSPEAQTAKITAVDPAGNTTIEEVPLEAAPGGVWLIAPGEIAEGATERVMAFASGGATIRIKVRGQGELKIIQDEPGVFVALLEAHSNVKLNAIAEPGRASAEVRYHPKPPMALVPSPTPVPVASPPPPDRLVEPRWELGAAIGARYSGDFAGVGGAIEYRHRVGRGRWHLGVDVMGLYADGNSAATDVHVGGVGARAVAELRLPVAPLAAFGFQAAAGALFLYEQRTPLVTPARDVPDATLTLALGVNVLAKVGPGLLILRLEFAWTPILKLDLGNVDGGVISIGYRYGRW
jgi:hypothetical protein